MYCYCYTWNQSTYIHTCPRSIYDNSKLVFFFCCYEILFTIIFIIYHTHTGIYLETLATFFITFSNISFFRLLHKCTHRHWTLVWSFFPYYMWMKIYGPTFFLLFIRIFFTNSQNNFEAQTRVYIFNICLIHKFVTVFCLSPGSLKSTGLYVFATFPK